MTQRLFKLSALAAAMGMAGAAQAVVNLNVADSSTNGSLTYASELTVSASGTTLTDSGTKQDLKAKLGFSVNSGAVRFVRIDLNNGAKFKNAPGLTVTNGSNDSTGSLSQGGAGSSFAIFEFTAAVNYGPNDTVNVDVANIDVVSQSDVTATYRLYETGTAASNPSSSSALANASQTAYRFSKALKTEVKTADTKTIDVATNSTKFESGVLVSDIANVGISVNSNVLWSTSNDAALTDLVAAGTKLVVNGSFTAVARDTSGTLDKTKVKLGTSDATTLTDSQATFDLGNTGLAAGSTGVVKMTVTGDREIADAAYTGIYDVVAATGSSIADADLGQLSKLKKNGSTAVANMMLNPNGVSRNWVRISNNSGITGRVFLRLRNDLGKSVTLNLGDVSGQQTTLAAGNATGLIAIKDIFDAAKAKDATFDIGTGGRNKLRLTVEGEFPAGTDQRGLVLDNITVATDNTSFSTFQ